MTANNPTDRIKLGTKRHILIDQNGIPLSTVITSASTQDIKTVTDIIDNSVVENYLKLMQLSCGIIIYRKIILG